MRVCRLTIAWVFGVCAMIVSISVDLSAQAVPDRLPRIVVDESIDEAPIASRVADALGSRRPIAFGARVTLSDVAGSAEALAARLALLDERRIPAWLAIPAPTSQAVLDEWRTTLAALLTRHGDRLTVLEVSVSSANDELRRFAVEFAATSARARRPGILIAASANTPAATAVLRSAAASSLAPYIDLLVVGEAEQGGQPARAAWTEFQLVERVDLDADHADADVQLRAIRRVLQGLGTSFAASLWRTDAARLVGTLRTLEPIAPLLTHDMSELEPAAVSLSVDRVGATGSSDLVTRVLFDNDTFTSFLLYETSGAGSVRIRVRLPVEAIPVVHDLVAGTRQPATDYRRDQSTAMAEATTPVTGRPMLVDFNDGAAGVLSDRTGVAAKRVLTVEEIVARHRQQQAAQDVLVRHYSARARMEQHFRPSLTDPGYDVVTENRYFVEGPVVEWEELSFSVNGSKWGSDRPPFP
ncbi:MAG: hypothetical protein LC791_14725, partial [Acidobacteria bacterium]|nr:hypothetical protein [Acidobacteriota bacterium]